MRREEEPDVEVILSAARSKRGHVTWENVAKKKHPTLSSFPRTGTIRKNEEDLRKKMNFDKLDK